MKTKDTFLNKLRSVKLLRILGYVSLPFFPALCFFITEYMNYDPYAIETGGLEAVTEAWSKHPSQHIFGLLAVCVIFAFLILLCRRAAIACGILGALACVGSYVNYMKFTLNGDNLFPRDLSMLESGGELLQFVSGDLPRWFYVGVAVTIICVAYLAIMRTEIPIKWFIRIPSSLLIAIVVCILFRNSASSAKLLNKFDLYYEDALLQTSNYKANGFVSAFIINALSMNVDEPSDYGKNVMDEIMDGYEYTDGNGEKYDVLVVLAESFFDVRNLNGMEFSENPLSNYDRITSGENCISGRIVTTAYKGGTARPEFNILTGLTTDYLPSGASPYEYINQETESFVSCYKDNGYRTTAIHLYDKKFYSRSIAYPLIGFDDFYDLSDVNGKIDLSYKRGYASDESTLAMMKYCMENTEEPLFLSTITIQNHQPYASASQENMQIKVSSDVLSEDVLGSVATYTQGLYDEDVFLGELVDYINSRERPTILLFYGDHLPTLGTVPSAYDETGYFDSETETKEFITYTTPFLIYSNRDLECDRLESAQNNDISAYYMLPLIMEMTDFDRTEYTNLLLSMFADTPYYNNRLKLEETESSKALERAMRYVAYDRIIGKAYSTK